MLARFFSYLTAIVNKNAYTARLFNYIMNNPLYRGVAVLGSGTAVAQLISIVTAPIITRLYTPSDMGVLAVYSSVLAIVGIGATLRYELAYALPRDNEDAINLFGLSLMLLCITTTVLALILLFGRNLLMNVFDLGALEQYIWFLLIGFFGMGLYTTLNYWAVRQRDYGRITYTKINQGIGGSVCKILLGILSFGPIGLIIGQIVSQVAGITTLARAMWKKEKERFKAISLSRMLSVAKEYKSFPVFNFPASIVNTIALQLPPLMLLALYDSRVVGLYSLAHMVVVLPGSLISGSMGQAYLGEASKMVRERSRELRSMYVRTLKHLSIVGVPLIGIPALCAPFIVPFIFGAEWAEAGWYCWPLAVMVIANFVVSPTSWLEIYGRNKWVLIWDIARLGGLLCGFYVGTLFELPPLAVILVYSLIMFFMYLIYILMNLKAIHYLEKTM